MVNQSCLQSPQSQCVPVDRYGQPYLTVIVQPESRARFRYQSEKGAHGRVKGEKDKSFPTVKLDNCNITDKELYAKASLYTNENEPEPHINKLFGPSAPNGICIQKFSKNFTAEFTDLRIEHYKKSEVLSVLYEKETAQLKASGMQLSDSVKKELMARAKEKAQKQSLDAVKICFEAFYYDSNYAEVPVCEKVYSNPIFHKNSPEHQSLRIHRIDKICGYVAGKEEVFLLCDKVDKKNIKVRFYEMSDGQLCWERFASFNEADVHYKVAIVFKTPAYKTMNIVDDVKVFLELFRPSDGSTSDSVEFVYKPNPCDKEQISRKRKKVNIYESSSGGEDSVYSVESPQSSSSSSAVLSDFSDLTSITDMHPVTFRDLGSNLNLPENSMGDISTSNLHVDMNNDPMMSSVQSMIDDQFPSTTVSSLENAVYFFDNLSDMGDYSMANNAMQYGTEVTAAGLLSFCPNAYTNMVPDSVCVPVNPPRASNPSKDQDTEEQMKKLSEQFSKGLSFSEPAADASEQEKHVLSRRLVHNFISKGNFRSLVGCVYASLFEEDQDGNNLLQQILLHQDDKCRWFSILLHLLKKFPASAVNHSNNRKQTPLHLAADKNLPDIVELLLKCHGDPYVADENGDLVIHIAAKHGFDDCLAKVLPHLYSTSKNVLETINTANYEGLTPLHCAVMSASAACVRQLCCVHADVNKGHLKSGRSSIHMAVEDAPHILDFLVHQPSVDVNKMDYSGNTPLSLAYCNKLDDKYIKILIEAGAKPCAQHSSDTDSAEEEEEEDEGRREAASDQSNCLSGTEKVESGKLAEAADSKNGCINNGAVPDDLIPPEVLNKLQNILDPPNDGWRSVALMLGFEEKHIDNMEKLEPSPTKAIINCFMRNRGTLVEIANALETSGLDEACKLLKESIPIHA